MIFRPQIACLLFAALCAQPVLAGQSEPSEQVFRATSNLVVVDVTVTDSHQNPVRGLTATDFKIFEDGRPQEISNFEESKSSDIVKLTPRIKLAPGTFTNRTEAPENGPLNILILDKLNTPLQDQAYVVQELKSYVKAMHPGTRIAIFGLTTQLRLLQGFTSDPAILKAVLSGKKGMVNYSALLDTPPGGDTAGMLDPTDGLFGNSLLAVEAQANLQQFEAERESFRVQMRIHYTLDAFNQLGRYLSTLPGRKNVLWFSGAFPINIAPNGDLADPFSVAADASDEFRETADLLVRSRVAIYPIDARGLMNAPAASAETSSNVYTGKPGEFGNKIGNFFTRNAEEHMTMQDMADSTGGIAYVNTNALKEAAIKAIEAGSNYYTISYSPGRKVANGDFRKIRVHADRPGLSLAYRRGYYADDNSVTVRTKKTASGKHAAPAAKSETPAAYNPYASAMLHGGPSPAEILFEAAVHPASTAEEPAVAAGNQPNPKRKGPYHRYAVQYSFDPHLLQCPTGPDKLRHCSIAFFAYIYSAEGELLNTQANALNAALSEAQYAAILKGKFVFDQQISIPVKGESFLRLGIYDELANRVGALELPVAAVAHLPAVAATTQGH